MSNFFNLYLKYTAATEAPTFFHRWCIITCLGAYLSRQTHVPHGFFKIYPNMYTMLIGAPGTKKSSAIKISAALMKQAGYKTFGAKKTRQEKFLIDLAEQNGEDLDGILEQNIFGDSYDSDRVTDCFVAADEFNNFIGVGNLDFMSILGELWDYTGVYDYKLKNAKSVSIPNPNISILGGNTPTGFSQAFPPEAIGQGFFSRLLLIYGEPSGVKITFPPPPDQAIADELIAHMHKIKETVRGEMVLAPDATDLVDKIYVSWKNLSDARLEHYANRRLIHLLKLCLVVTAARLSLVISVEDVIYANTILTYTEYLMPKALGEFGSSRNSTTTHKIMSIIDNTRLPIDAISIWKQVATDLERRDQLMEILSSLKITEKIQAVDMIGGDGKGYLPIRAVLAQDAVGVDMSLIPEADV